MGRGEMLLTETEDALDDLIPNLRRLLGPALLSDLSLAGEGIQLLANTISPSRPPDIYSGIASVITGRFRGSGAGSVTVSGTGIDGSPWASRAEAVPVDGRALTQLWARTFLADLQYKYLRCRFEDAAGLERLIITTSLRFGVLTRLTAFVAVSNAPARATGAPRQVIQSVELPSDWTEVGPSLSPYAVDYARILASASNPPAGQRASQPIRDPQASRPTAASTENSQGSYPAPAPPMTSAPGASFPGPPSWPGGPTGPPSRKSGSRVGKAIGASVGAVAVAASVSVFGMTITKHESSTAPALTTQAPPPTTFRPTTAATTTTSRTATNVDPRTGARLEATVTPEGSGSMVTARMSGIPEGSKVILIVVGRDGIRHEIVNLVTTAGTSTRSGHTTLRVAEIASIAIENPSMEIYVSASLQ
jgi:hypothetical protein